jgi:TolB-like protein/class 3 adenylate cyclase/tetratricopeptide (TPR) repeat protein
LTGERVERRLAAILAADVEGYSRLMGTDEVGTLRNLTERRAILDGLIASHRGRIANTGGDSVLAEFGSAVDAVQCAVEAQAALATANAGLSPDRQMNFRIGIHVGDVMVKGGDLFGDGVNIAARLQTIASAGGVCLSGAAHDQVKKILPFAFTDLGAQQVKNIEEPVRAFSVSAKNASSTTDLLNTSMPLALPDKPSIAVLPFQNMSGDPEQEYFADGMVEDIITALSRFKSLFVIARNSSFTYKGKAVDIKQVGRDLGVRYVLEGSVRKAGGKVRITGQLIDAMTGAHLWADKIDGPLEDIFDLQDKVTTRVVGAIAPKLDQAEIERASRNPPKNLDAYDCYLRGLACRRTGGDRRRNDEALRHFYRAIELDPQMGSAYGSAAYCYHMRKLYGWVSEIEPELAETRRLAENAVKLGHDDADTLARAAHVFGYIFRELDKAKILADQAISINPNLAFAWQVRGWVSVWLGQNEQAVEQLDRSMRFNPIDPANFGAEAAKSHALVRLKRYEEAVQCAASVLTRQPKNLPALRSACVALALAGRLDEAREMLRRLLELDPLARISNIKESAPISREEDLELLVQGYRLVGLPE